MHKCFRFMCCFLLLAVSFPANAQSRTDDNLEKALRTLLKEKPELVMNVLREHSEQVLDQ